MTGYDDENIFAKILRGEIPCHKIYEDEHTFGFMDIMPQTEGHSLVLPKQPSRNLLDADPAVFEPLMTTVQKIARASRAAFKTDGVLIMQFNEPGAGQTVFHLHFHIIPRSQGMTVKPHSGARVGDATLARHAEMIRAALAAA